MTRRTRTNGSFTPVVITFVVTLPTCAHSDLTKGVDHDAAPDAGACGFGGTGGRGPIDLGMAGTGQSPADDDCPRNRPEPSSACRVATSTACVYAGNEYLIMEVAKCIDGAWSIEAPSTCDPPTPYEPCPRHEPGDGAVCNVDPSTVCIYGYCAAHSPYVTEMRCAGASWKMQTRNCPIIGPRDAGFGGVEQDAAASEAGVH